MRAILFLPIALILGCATPTPPIPGQTLTNGSSHLKHDTLRAISLFEAAASPSREQIIVVDTQIIQPPPRIGLNRADDLINTKWTERWIIKRGESNAVYQVRFDAQGSRGTDILVGYDRRDFLKGPTKVYDIP